MKASGIYAIALFLSLAAMATAGTFTVDIDRTDGGGDIQVSSLPQTIEFEITGDLTEDGNLGLAFFAFDLEMVGPEPIDLGTAILMLEHPDVANFSAPQGYSVDFAGTPIGDDLIQCGGGQNTINNPGPPDFPEFPVGSVDLSVGHGGVTLFFTTAGFGLTLPAGIQAGDYTLQVKPNSLYANEIVSENAGEYEVDPVDAVVIGNSMTISVVDCVAPPAVVTHLAGAGETTPCSGYIDPRPEGDVAIGGCAGGAEFGVDSVVMKFNTAVFGAADGATPLAPENFTVMETGAGPAPGISAVTALGDNSEIQIDLDRAITLGEWTTIIASDVYNECGLQVDTSAGNQGPGVNEIDRIDIAHYPGDVDGNGDLEPFDLLAFRLFAQNGTFPGTACSDDELVYFDMDHNGTFEPFDLLEFRLLINEGCTIDWEAAPALVDQP
jgi:hypothetical protein